MSSCFRTLTRLPYPGRHLGRFEKWKHFLYILHTLHRVSHMWACVCVCVRMFSLTKALKGTTCSVRQKYNSSSSSLVKASIWLCNGLAFERVDSSLKKINKYFLKKNQVDQASMSMSVKGGYKRTPISTPWEYLQSTPSAANGPIRIKTRHLNAYVLKNRERLERKNLGQTPERTTPCFPHALLTL